MEKKIKHLLNKQKTNKQTNKIQNNQLQKEKNWNTPVCISHLLFSELQQTYLIQERKKNNKQQKGAIVLVFLFT